MKIIRDWLMNSLGIIIDFDKDFPKKIQDGYLIGQILSGFDIISKEELTLIKKTDDKDEGVDNFINYILIWLGRLDIILTEDDVYNIVNCNDNTGMNILFELYLACQDKSKLDFIAQKRAQDRCKIEHPRFKVTKFKQSLLEDVEFEPNDLSMQLIDNKDVIKWNKDYLESIQKECDQSLEEYKKHFKEKNKKDDKDDKECICKTTICLCPKYELEPIPDFPEDAFQDLTYEQLIKLNDNSKKQDQLPNYQEAQAFVKNLKKKKISSKDRYIEKLKKQTEECEEAYRKLKEKLLDKIDDIIDEKILTQSYFEKQMMTKLMQVKHQQKVMEENRLSINEEIMKQSEDTLSKKLIKDLNLDDECMCDYLREKQRIFELHQKIYNERIKLKKERTRKICAEVTEDLVDLAIRIGEYKEEFIDEPPREKYKNWVSLFLKCGSILPVISPPENIIQDLTFLLEEEEGDYIEEIERQEIMDSNDYERYQKHEWPWELENIKHLKYNQNVMVRGMNIIGFLVHKLLSTKYPTQQLKPKPDFNFDYKVCVNGLTDTSIPEKLQHLLEHKDIVVFEVINAVNYCLDKFSNERNIMDDDTQAKTRLKEIDKKPKSSHTKLLKGKKGKAALQSVPSRSGSSKLLLNDGDFEDNELDKQIQTPKIFPSEDLKFSDAAILGEIANETLNKGESLTDYLIGAMIVEYLYTISNKKGWALINYPSSYNQAVVLEENLSSIPLKKDETTVKSIIDLIELDEERLTDIIQRDKNSKRTSKLFPLPQVAKEEETYNTELTAYIKIIKATVADIEDASVNFPPVSKLIDANAERLDHFYAEQGCNYSMYYESFDHETIKYLARLIIGDFALPRKPSVELFGTASIMGDDTSEAVTSKVPKSSRDISNKEKGKKKLIIKKENEETEQKQEPKEKDLKKKKSKTKKLEIENESFVCTTDNKETQVPPLEDVFEIIIEEEDPNILPGEEKWKYQDLPMSEEMLLLAKMCENMETVYVEDLKQVFFMRRTSMGAIQPYIRYVEDHLINFINKPDNRQQILHDFQITYDTISEHHRIDDEVKAELHCRINELKMNLSNVTERNIMELFAERDRIIEQHWLRRQLHEMLQIYMCAIQLELDRFIDTLQLISDYYISGITNSLPEETHFQKEIMKGTDSDKVSSYESFTQWEDAFDVKYFSDKITQKYAKSLDYVEKTKSTAIKLIFNTQGKFAAVKPKVETNKKKVKVAPSLPGVQNAVRDNMDKIMDEWRTAIEGETERIHLRLKLLEHESKERFREMSSRIKKMMMSIYGMIRKRHNNEKSSIEQLCDVIANAVENETPIRMELRLDRDDFYVQPEVILFPEDLPPTPPPPIKEWKKESVFTISQLKKFFKVLRKLAPTGTIPERMFTYILHDALVHDIEDGEEPLAPDLWRQLTTLELEQVMTELFSKSECINWYDFIIYNLLIKMPTVEEILDLQNTFKKLGNQVHDTILIEKFKNMTLWFENQFCTQFEYDKKKRLVDMKDLLCDMYKVDEKRIHFTSLLVDFCKDTNGTAGFAKLLGLILNRPVCWDVNIGKNYVKQQMKLRAEHEKSVQERDNEIEESKDTAKEIVDEITDETVHRCDSVIITEIRDSDESIIDRDCADQCICDLECYCADKRPRFSNVSIGFEANIDPALVYFLDFQTIIEAESHALHWYTKVQNIDGQSFRQKAEEIYKECENPEFNNAVLAHEFLNNKKFSELLANTTRFTDKNPSNFVQNLINFRKN